MNSSNMLSAQKVKLHGMTSTKWTTKDKITQYKGLINLYTRDKKIIGMDNIIARKKQVKEVKNLQKEIENSRKTLDNAIRGDKQKLRNTLAEHRQMQLAFQNAQPQKVVDMVNQANFTQRKTRDILKYRMKLKSESLIELKLKCSAFEDRIKYEGISWQTMLPCERQAHLITGKVQDAILKKEAAIYIRNAYKEMIAIMKKDALYFDAILISIKNDGLSQGKCMINATKMGQLGTEYLDDRRQEFQILEKIVKRDIISRKKDLAQVQQNVGNFSDNLKNLLRRDSDINLGRVKLPQSESYIELNRDIEAIEHTLNMLKNSIFTQTIESIYPCIKEQLRQKERLTSLVEKCEKNRDDLLKKDNHAHMMQSVLENSMIETTSQYNSKKQELMSNIADEEKRSQATQQLITNRYDLLARIRLSLRHLQYLSRLLNTTSMNKKSLTIMFKKPDDVNEINKPEEDEVDATRIIPELNAKLIKLATGAKEILTGSTMEEGYRMFESLMRERNNLVQVDTKISEESLIETVFADAHVLTRDDIKKQSSEIVAANRVTDDIKPVLSSKKKRFKFKK